MVYVIMEVDHDIIRGNKSDIERNNVAYSNQITLKSKIVVVEAKKDSLLIPVINIAGSMYNLYIDNINIMTYTIQ